MANSNACSPCDLAQSGLQPRALNWWRMRLRKEIRLITRNSARALYLLFAFTITGILTTTLWGQEQPLTAAQVIERIKTKVGVPWKSETVDTFKAGDPNTQVTGIAVTMMATLDVLQRAIASGHNLIITHEPTFYSHEDNPEGLPAGENDPVLADKRKFIADHKLIIWRFHDHWHAHKPDGIELGMVHALGWERFQDSRNQYLFSIPQTTLRELAEQVGQTLGIRTLRIVGDPDLKVTKLALSPGASGFANETGALEMPDVQALILGETREWETVEYAADAISEGKQKALVLLGHIPSEQAGMEECTRWLKGFVKEVPVDFMPARDPFWRP
jgi:putative NIF3 family GTP cyclohydrolase 1 type 2